MPVVKGKLERKKREREEDLDLKKTAEAAAEGFDAEADGFYEAGGTLTKKASGGKSLDPCVQKVMVVSTECLTEKTRELLTADSFLPELRRDPDLPVFYPCGRVEERGTEGTYGWFVLAAGHDDDEDAAAKLPEDLLAGLRFASANGCDWIRYDRDADVPEGFPIPGK